LKLGLIVSNDWELYGDGSGKFYEHQYKPTEDLLITCEEHGAKLTLMAEVGQQWAHQKLGETEKWAYDIAKAWETQAKDAIKRKHDVQLHLHPQWLKATFINGKWVLDSKYSVFSGLPQREQEEVLKAGKEYLENLLHPVDTQYSCIGFRAGATYTKPYKNVVQSLLNVGILSDTSVTKGDYDYRDAHSHYKPWFTNLSNIKIQGKANSELLEIPIYSVPIIDSPLLRKTFFPHVVYRYNFGLTLPKRDKNWIKSRNKYVLNRCSLLQRPVIRNNMTNVKWIISQVIRKGCLQLDYVSVPASIFVYMLQRLAEEIEQNSRCDKELIFPVMAFGHVKAMTTCDNINRIFEKIKAQFGGKVIFWTYSDAIQYWIDHFKDAKE